MDHDCRLGDSRFSVFQKELQNTTHHLRKTLEGLASPAPTLKYLLLAAYWDGPRVPDTLFNGTTPRLSCLQLYDCTISWKSPLLKGLRNLNIHSPSEGPRPGLSDWLDALDKMLQLKTLTLCSASPIPPLGALLPSGVERTVTLPSLAHNISASVRDCGFALAHLLLPTLTHLGFTATSHSQDDSDVQEIHLYVARHARRPQDTQPLQMVVVRSKCSISTPTRPTRSPLLMSHSLNTITNKDWSPEAHVGVFDAAMAALPMNNLVILNSQCYSNLLNKRVSHIRHLGISTEHHLRKTLEGLVSPAPALEYLSLDCGNYAWRSSSSRVFIPDTLFDGATPRLSCLELRSCDIGWKSPLLKGLRHLEINTVW
ncbi:hypothetical protein EDB85DRAFT_647139 [Lactarius pseudohatsudake]|nr:hypothetical protein EDB85DRAFT_647139 [Lactarius pseudohatsudake]